MLLIPAKVYNQVQNSIVLEQFLKSNKSSDINHHKYHGKLINFDEFQFYKL